MTLLTTLVLTATTAMASSPFDATPTYEPTPPPTLNAPAIDRSEADAIEKGVKTWLAKTNPEPDVEMVQVRVETDGTVHLDGSVASADRKAEVLRKVRDVDDVAAVESDLAVVSAKREDAGSLSFPSMDTTDPLASDDAKPAKPEDAVLEALLDSAYVEARGIEVSMTDEGHVQLTGSVDTAAQRDAAGRIARRVVEEPVDVNLRVRP